MGGAVPAFGERIRSKSFKICSKILVEIGLGQREEVEALAKATGFRLLKVVHDLQKIPRILVFEEEIHIK
jgi:methylase of polypeptide subunit release factors